MSSDVSEGGLSTAEPRSSLSWWRVWRALTASPLEFASRMGTELSMAWRSRAVLFNFVAALSDLHRTWAMPKPLLALNLLLVGLSTLFFVSVVRALFVSDPRPAIHVQRPIDVAASPARGHGSNARRSTGYDLIVGRNLFHPDRSESTRAGLVARDVAPATKPVLYGVVLSDDAGLAYLEDPTTKRVLVYRIGDDLAGGRIERIERDRVVISRADGQVEVFLSGSQSSRPAGIGPVYGQPNGSVAPARRIPKD
jgi:hypothetical protein